MFAPAPSPKRFPLTITPASGDFAWAAARSARKVAMSWIASSERVFIAPESKVTQAMPLRSSYVKLPIVRLLSRWSARSADEIECEGGEAGIDRLRRDLDVAADVENPQAGIETVAVSDP